MGKIALYRARREFSLLLGTQFDLNQITVLAAAFFVPQTGSFGQI
jgi:hypothetical protein